MKCIYCGATENLTRDHIPPKCLFPDPKPTDLITVPACKSCNKSFELDDELFRAFALTQAYDDPVGQKLWEGKVVGSTLKRSPALKKTLAKRVTTVELRSYAGLYLGKAPALLFPRDRIDRVIKRIVRGLLWHHYQIKPGPDIKFLIWQDPEVKGIVHEHILKTKLSSIGGSIFQYRHATAVEDPEQSVWFLRFYTKTTILVVLMREDSVAQGSHSG